MSDLFAPWITDPDDPTDGLMSSEDAAQAARALAEAFPDLVDRSMDGPFKMLPPDDTPLDDESEDEGHQHDGAAFDRHRVRMGKRKTLRVHGQTMATWARMIAEQDAQNIQTAISVGLTAGEDNTDIAHRVIGSRRLNGVNGATETTRQHIYRIGRGLLAKRKSLMRGQRPE